MVGLQITILKALGAGGGVADSEDQRNLETLALEDHDPDDPPLAGGAVPPQLPPKSLEQTILRLPPISENCFPAVLTHLRPDITQQAATIPGANSLHQSQDLPLPRLKGHSNINFSSIINHRPVAHAHSPLKYFELPRVVKSVTQLSLSLPHSL